MVANENIAPLEEIVGKAAALPDEAMPAEEEEVELTTEQKKEKVTTLLASGKRDFYAGSYAEAAETLGEANELVCEVYPKYAPEWYEPHFYYGKAHLELGRMEEDVIENALEGVPEGDDEEEEEAEAEAKEAGDAAPTAEEKEQIREQVIEAMTEERGEVEKDGEEGTDEVDEAEEAKEKSQMEETKEEEGAAEQKTEEETNGEEATADADESMEDDEEPSHLQVAWEVFEVAKKVAESQPEDEVWLRRRADILIHLAQCSIESEQYERALEDLGIAENFLQMMEQQDTRLTVEIFFHCARAQKLDNRFPESANFYQRAKAALEEALAILAAKDTLSDEEKATKSDYESLLPDVQLKIADALASAAQVVKAKDMLKDFAVALSDANVGAPASDISGLVRKKRPATEEGAEGEAKRAKSEEAQEEKKEEEKETETKEE